MDKIRNTRILSSITEILVPKTKEEIVQALTGIYKFDVNENEIDTMLNLHNMISITTCDAPQGVLSFIDYVESPEVVNEGELQTLGLQLFSKNISITKRVESFTNIYEEVKGKINEYHTTYVPTNMQDDISLDRYYQYSILGAGNKIAMESRRGPSNFVIMSMEMFTLTNPMLSGNKIIIDDSLENEIIVGRNGALDEPGIHLIFHENKYEITVTGSNVDKFYVKIPYKL